MFNIESVRIENFKSYAWKHEFEFPTKPGLYFLTGDNKAEPQLGSNGAGKSTLLDAVYWCLYGRTLRGLKASDVVTWGQASCAVSVQLVVANETMIITRTQSPNSLTLETMSEQIKNVVTQEAIEKEIGLNADSFVYAIILPQFGQSFFELKPAEKLSLFSQIMDLDYWLERSDKAAEVTAALAKDVDNAINKIQTMESHCNSIVVDIEELKAKSKLFETERKAAMAEIDATAEKLDADLEALTARLEILKKFDRTVSIKLAARKKVLAGMAEIVNVYRGRKDKLREGRAMLKANIDNLQTSLTKLTGIGTQCPTCKQSVDKRHLKFEEGKLIALINDQIRSLRVNEKETIEAQKFFNKTVVDHDKLDEVVQGIANELAENQKQLAMCKTRFKGVESQAAMASNELKKREKQDNPYDSIIIERYDRMDKLTARIQQAKDDLDVINSQHEAYKYWITGFKRIRLFIIEETLRSLELEVNNALGSLGLIDWSVEFDVERENKSGGVTKGFVVFIRCPANPEPVRWESWSGGETQRLQLAGDFGLANLIMMRAGLTNTIEFYDEPSDHLSEEGLTDLAETLYSRAKTERKKIFLVDHRVPDFGGFAGVYTVTKDNKGSCISQ